MAVVKIFVDGTEVLDLTPPVKVTLLGTGVHEIKYLLDSGIIKSQTFQSCDLDEVTIGKGITQILSLAFEDSSVSKINFSEDTVPQVQNDSFPSNVIIIADTNNLEAVLAIKDMYGIDWIPSTTAKNVGDVLYEMDGGGLYVLAYDPTNTDTPIGVCVIPSGLYDEHAHFIALSDIAYDDNGKVIEVANNSDRFLYWAPYSSGYFATRLINCYTRIPYIGMLCKTGEETSELHYASIDVMPDVVNESRTYFTRDTHLVMLETPQMLDVSDKTHLHSVLCPFLDEQFYPSLPGAVDVSNPYDAGTEYTPALVSPCLVMETSGNYYKFTKTYFAPSPYVKYSEGKRTILNDSLIADASSVSSLPKDLGNPFAKIDSSYSDLLEKVIDTAVKPSTYDDLTHGVVSANSVTFFPAPYCAYEYSPGELDEDGESWTTNQWALGTPLLWLCTFARLSKVNEVINKLGKLPIIDKFYWTGTFANDGQVYVAAGGAREMCCITTANPRFKTRPFIII